MAYSRQEAAQKIIEAGHALVEQGLIARTWGNISARLSDTEFLITPSGMAYDDLTPELLVTCKIADCSYQGKIRPSSEKGVHGEAYKFRKDIDFIIHTHQLYATAVGTVGQPITGRDEEEQRILGQQAVCADYAISSTERLKRKVSQAIVAYPQSNAFFMRYHGVLCLGQTDVDAFRVSRTLEDICKEMIDEQLHLDLQPVMGFPKECSKDRVLEAVHRIAGYPAVLFDASSAVQAVTAWDKKLYPVIDDMAQIAGTSYVCIDPGVADYPEQIARALRKKNCVFVKGLGAVCGAVNEEEVQAVAMVLEKNCLATLYGTACGVQHHLGLVDAALQRNVYVKKYSKLK